MPTMPPEYHREWLDMQTEEWREHKRQLNRIRYYTSRGREVPEKYREDNKELKVADSKIPLDALMSIEREEWVSTDLLDMLGLDYIIHTQPKEKRKCIIS